MKRTLILSSAAVAVAALALFGARILGPRVVTVPAPKGAPIGEFDTPRAERSLLAVEFSAPLALLETIAEERVPERFTGSDTGDLHRRLKDVAYVWEVERGAVSLRNTGESLAFSAPFEGGAIFTGTIDAQVVSIPLETTVEIAGQFNGTLSPEVAADWSIEPRIDPELSLTRAEMGIAGLGSVDLGGVLGRSLAPLIQREIDKLGATAGDHIDLRRDALAFWEQAHFSDEVSSNPPVWVSIVPQGLVLGPFNYSDPERIGVSVAVEAETIVANRELPRPPPGPLPPLTLLADPPATDLRIPVVANIAELNEVLREESFDLDTGVGARIEVSGMEVSIGQEGFLDIKLSLQADKSRVGRGVAGDIWVRGRPVVDYEAQTLGFGGVELTLETQDRLAAAAGWLLEGILVRAIEGQLRVDLNDYQEELDKEVQKALAEADLPPGLEVSLQGLEVRLADIYTVTRQAPGGPADPAIVLVVSARGDISTRFEVTPGVSEAP